VTSHHRRWIPESSIAYSRSESRTRREHARRQILLKRARRLIRRVRRTRVDTRAKCARARYTSSVYERRRMENRVAPARSRRRKCNLQRSYEWTKGCNSATHIRNSPSRAFASAQRASADCSRTFRARLLGVLSRKRGKRGKQAVIESTSPSPPPPPSPPRKSWSFFAITSLGNLPLSSSVVSIFGNYGRDAAASVRWTNDVGKFRQTQSWMRSKDATLVRARVCQSSWLDAAFPYAVVDAAYQSSFSISPRLDFYRIRHEFSSIFCTASVRCADGFLHRCRIFLLLFFPSFFFFTPAINANLRYLSDLSEPRVAPAFIYAYMYALNGE